MPKTSTAENAQRLATRLKELLGHDQIAVRAHGSHLHIRLVEADMETVVARLTEIRTGKFAAAYRNHSGRWEPLPGVGQLEQAAQIVVDCLGTYLEPLD